MKVYQSIWLRRLNSHSSVNALYSACWGEERGGEGRGRGREGVERCRRQVSWFSSIFTVCWLTIFDIVNFRKNTFVVAIQWIHIAVFQVRRWKLDNSNSAAGPKQQHHAVWIEFNIAILQHILSCQPLCAGGKSRWTTRNYFQKSSRIELTSTNSSRLVSWLSRMLAYSIVPSPLIRNRSPDLLIAKELPLKPTVPFGAVTLLNESISSGFMVVGRFFASLSDYSLGWLYTLFTLYTPFEQVR